MAEEVLEVMIEQWSYNLIHYPLFVVHKFHSFLVITLTLSDQLHGQQSQLLMCSYHPRSELLSHHYMRYKFVGLSCKLLHNNLNIHL